MPPKKKDKYCIRNWKEYNQSLVNRGSITFWFDENTTQKLGIWQTQHLVFSIGYKASSRLLPGWILESGLYSRPTSRN